MTLQSISSKVLLKKTLQNKWLLRFGFILLILIFGLVSYGRAFDYYFWRDDAKTMWMEHFAPNVINNLHSDSVSRGRIGAVIFDYLEYAFLGYSSVLHQSFGFVLRIVSVFLIYFLSKALFRSKRVALVSCLFASVYIGGLEAFSWVRGIGAMVIISEVSLILYLKSYYKNSKILFSVSLITTSLALLIDFWRTLGLVFILLLWEIMGVISNKSDISKKVSLIRLSVIVIFFIIVFKLLFILMGENGASAVGTAPDYISWALSGINFGHLAISLGNLFRIPFIFVSEEAGLTNGGFISLIAGFILLFLIGGVSLWFLIKRDKKIMPWVVILVWILLFYGPNWMFAQATDVSVTHRYFAISAVVIPIFWAKIFVSKLPIKLGIAGILIFLVFALSHALWVTNTDYNVRGKSVILSYWNEIVNNTPPGETNPILSITGDNRMVNYIFAWSDVFPYGNLKGINNTKQLPVYVDAKLAADIICNPLTPVHDPFSGGTYPAGNNFSINKAYAWNVTDGRMISNTDEFRINIARSAQCLWKDGVAVIPLKQTKNMYAVLTSWKRFVPGPSAFYYTITITPSSENIPLDKKIGKVEFDSSQTNVVSYIVTNLQLEENTSYVIKIIPDFQKTRIISLNELLSLSNHGSRE